MIALLADIHGNREALTACLADATRKAERYVFLGDLVGYGADPGWVVDCAMKYVEQGALAVLGNHDAAVSNPGVTMNEIAREAIDWTRRQLNAAQRDFLQGLPASLEEAGRLYVHASAHQPLQWHYILDSRDAQLSFETAAARQTFCGHVHVPALYHRSQTGRIFEFTPGAAAAIPLLPSRRWLAVLGAVGQPRDRNAAACYGLLDERHDTLTYVRVVYDVATAARKIRDAGLPPVLAARLLQGC